jgi:hypothetical protein
MNVLIGFGTDVGRETDTYDEKMGFCRNVLIGPNNKVLSGSDNLVVGSNNIVEGNNNIVFGSNLNIKGDDQRVIQDDVLEEKKGDIMKDYTLITLIDVLKRLRY